jgi:DNA-binding NarL/FixJ family response regulator
VAGVSEQIRVLVVDDDALVRAGLAMLLAGVEEIARGRGRRPDALPDGHSPADRPCDRRPDMSVATVKAHVSCVLEKLELNNRVQIALLAHDAGEA